MVWGYMLQPFDADEYILMTYSDFDHPMGQGTAFQRLPAPYFRLKTLTEADIEAMPLLRVLRPVDPYRPLLMRRLLRPFWMLYGDLRERLKKLLLQGPTAHHLLAIHNRARQIERYVKENDCNAIVSCSGNLYDMPASMLASKWCKVPLLVYIMDDFRFQFTGSLRRYARWYEPRIMKHAAGIAVLNSFLQRAIRHRYGLDSTVIHIPTIIPDPAQFEGMEQVLEPETTNIVYAGSLYHAHYDAFRNMVHAIASLNRPEIRLHIFTSQPREELASNGIAADFLVFHPHVAHSQVPGVLRQADVLFLALAFESPIDDLIVTTSPSKMGENLAAGRPIIVHAPAGCFMVHYFEENDCGVVVKQNDSGVLASALADLLDNPERQRELTANAMESAKKDFEVSKVQARFREFLQKHLGAVRA